MKTVPWALLALWFLGAPARADMVILKDGREIRGAATYEGDSVVVTREHGSARFPRDDVAKIRSDEEVKKEEEKAEAARAEKKRDADAEVGRMLARLVAEKGMGAELPAKDRIVWEKDPAAAAKRAREENKIVLTFVVVGDLGTGHC